MLCYWFLDNLMTQNVSHCSRNYKKYSILVQIFKYLVLGCSFFDFFKSFFDILTIVCIKTNTINLSI